MKTKIFLFICFINLCFNSFSQVPNKDEILTSKQISDIIAKSIYIYSQSTKDTNILKKQESLNDLKDNIRILDTLVFSQIQDYLKFNKAILNSLDSNDISKFDSISTLHSQLYNELKNLLTFQKKKQQIKESFLDIKLLTANTDEDIRSLHSILLNNSEFKIEVIITITDERKKEVARIQKVLLSYQYLELNSLKDYFTSESLNIYYIAKFTNNLGKSYYFSKMLENYAIDMSSLKLIFVFSQTDQKENNQILTKEIDNLFHRIKK